MQTKRTRSFPLAGLLAAFAAVSLAPSAHAQSLPGIGFGASVGANVPQGRYGDGANTGLVANGFAELRLGGPALRGELFWSRSDIDNAVIRRVGNAVLPPGGAGDVSGNVNLVGGIASLVLPLGQGPVQPYLIGGVGVYRRRVAQDIDGTITEFRNLRESDNEVGYNGGAGLRLNALGASVFIEGRYHSVRTKPEKTNFIPVVVGLSF